LTNFLKKKREQEREEAVKGRESRQKKVKAVKVALLTLTMLVGFVIVVNSVNSDSQRHRIVGYPPSHYQQGILVSNVTQTFATEYEWNFNFTPGSTVNVRLVLTGQAPVQVQFGTTSAFSTNLLTGSYAGPFVMSGVLKPSNPTMTWTGQIPSGGGYKIELVNVGYEGSVASVQAYVDAQ